MRGSSTSCATRWKSDCPSLPSAAACKCLTLRSAERYCLIFPATTNSSTRTSQELRFINGAQVRIPRVNSSHHQALDRLGTGLSVEARCSDDEIIEQARLREYPFCLGVQFHPERDPLYQPLFDAFVAAIRQPVP